MSVLNIAVVGLGSKNTSRARDYLATINKLTHMYKIVSLCDQNQDVLNEIGAKYAVKYLYQDVEKMLDEIKPDVLFILVPTDGQLPLAMVASQKGCNIITEIPYSVTLAYGDAIAKSCEENNVKWEIAENAWLWPHEILKQKMIQEDVIGAINNARLWYTSGSYHGLSAIRESINSIPKRVLGYAKEIPVETILEMDSMEFDGDNHRWWETALIEFQNGVFASYEMSFQPGARPNHWEIEGTKGYVYGNGINTDKLVLYEGSKQIEMPFVDSFKKISGEDVLFKSETESLPKHTWFNPFFEFGISYPDDIAKGYILSSMYSSLVSGEPIKYGASKARMDLGLCFNLRHSQNIGNAWTDYPLPKISDLEKNINDLYVRKYGADPINDPFALLGSTFDRSSVIWIAAGWM